MSLSGWSAPAAWGGLQGRDPRLDRIVAIKVLPEGVTASPQTLTRFQREARAASALNHPNICTIYDVGEQDPPFIVMEFLEGETLQQRLAERPLDVPVLVGSGSPLPTRSRPRTARHRASRHQARQHLPHGARAEDARLRTREGASGSAASTPSRRPVSRGQLTEPGSVLGTVAYMSPEQVRAEPLDARTDLFSFGVVLYEMATGTLPFRGDSSAVVFAPFSTTRPCLRCA